MGRNMRSTVFLKECMADALLQLMLKKDFARITVNEIADAAGVNRSTWFRNFPDKHEALTFKLILLWERWAVNQGMGVRQYHVEDAPYFFRFIYENQDIFRLIYQSQAQSVVYDAFYRIMMAQADKDIYQRYNSRFYSFGLFGLLNEWVQREFSESPEDMSLLFERIISNHWRGDDPPAEFSDTRS